MNDKTHVLIVEDDRSVRNTMCGALRDAGYAVSPYGSSHAALSALEGDHPAEILISAVRMPPGQPHGFALARMARIRRPDIKIIYVTAYPELAKEDSAAELGPVIEKPFAVDELAETKAPVSSPGAVRDERPTPPRPKLIETARLLRREQVGHMIG
jgi:DNA-binding NtrC family response regulator